MLMLHIKLKGMKYTIYKQIHFSPLHAPLTTEWGQNNLFSENGHVAYPIKENGTNKSNNFVPYRHPRSLGWGQKFFFLEVFMLHIKLKQMGIDG